MRTIGNSLTVLMGILIILSTQSCTKDEDTKDHDNSGLSKNLSFTYENYFFDYTWIVLHSLDGSEVSDYKKIESGNGVANFGPIEGSYATFSIIDVGVNYKKKGDMDTYYFIETYYNVPCIDWEFTYTDVSDYPIGTAEILMTYPEEEYDKYYVSTSTFNSSSDDVPVNGVQISKPLYRVDEGNKYSIYGAVMNNAGGYCNWLLEQDFLPDQSNIYNLDLANPITMKNISSTLPISIIYCWGYLNQRQTDLTLYKQNYQNQNPNSVADHLLYIPEGIPLEEFALYGSYFDNNMAFSCRKYYDQSQGIPTIFTIPDKSIAASYDETSGAINNIQVYGDVDMVFGFWLYNDFKSKDNIVVYWRVQGDQFVTSLNIPILPQEVYDDIGVDVNMLEAHSVGFFDYDITTGLDEFINRIPTAGEMPYHESFNYQYFFDGKGGQISQDRLKKIERTIGKF